MATVHTLYPVGTQSVTIVNPAGSSSSFTAGGESDAISNVSNLDLDHLITGDIDITQSPSVVGTQMQIWVVPCQTDDLASTVTWPDVFDGTASTETVTSYGVLQGCGRLGQVINVDTTASSTFYFVGPFSVASLFGGVLPTRYVIFLVQNTGKIVAWDSSVVYYTRFQATVS